MDITCGCGHKAPFDEFTRTPIFGDLPPGQFQCPKCRHAFQRKGSGFRILRAGSEAMIIHDRVDLLPIMARF